MSIQPLHALLALGLALALAACSDSGPSQPQVELSEEEKMISGVDAVRLRNAVLYSDRPEADRARDKYRHPFETLQFMGIWSSARVVELWPGGGWYTRVLVPYLNRDGAEGKLYLAHFPISSRSSERVRELVAQTRRTIQTDPLYANTELTTLGRNDLDFAPPGSVDFVLTFRNLHNWLAGDYMQEVFHAAYKALAPGGVMGVVEHRAKPGTSLERMKRSGYVTQALAVEMAEEAGFVFEASLEVNANPADTADHPNGVWSLPPSLRGGDEGRERFLQIGESDRMTLRFRKPLRQ